jgi:hypothetical protein
MAISAKLGALAMAVTPFIWSVVVHSGAAPTPLSITVPERPGLAFRQYAVDLGPIQPTPEARATFVSTSRPSIPVAVA